MSLVDENRQWFKAKIGLGARQQTDRAHAFCAHAIMEPTKLFIVPDARLDKRFADNPLVTDKPHIRFYAGAPLVCNGLGIGTLCVIDVKPRKLTRTQTNALTALAKTIEVQLQLRLAITTIRSTRDETREKNKALIGELELLRSTK